MDEGAANENQEVSNGNLAKTRSNSAANGGLLVGCRGRKSEKRWSYELVECLGGGLSERNND